MKKLTAFVTIPMEWLYYHFRKLVKDTCQDPNGVYNSLKIMRNLCFGFGLYSAMQYPALESRWTFLVLLGFGSQGIKTLNSYFERKTADGNGNALAQSGTETAPNTPVIPATAAKADPVVEDQ